MLTRGLERQALPPAARARTRPLPAAALDLRAVGFKEQALLGVRVYTSDDVREAVDMVIDGSLRLDRLPVTVVPLERAAEAFRVAESGEGCVKVLVSVAS